MTKLSTSDAARLFTNEDTAIMMEGVGLKRGRRGHGGATTMIRHTPAAGQHVADKFLAAGFTEHYADHAHGTKLVQLTRCGIVVELCWATDGLTAPGTDVCAWTTK